MTETIPVSITFSEDLWRKLSAKSLNMSDPTLSSAEILQFVWRVERK